MSALQMSLALDRYDRHAAIIGGLLECKDIELDAYEIGQGRSLRDGDQRHARVLVNREFDAGEISLASFIAAAAGGNTNGLSAIPVFPRRLFTASQLYCSLNSDLTHASELAGRRVGLRSFQVTLSVLFRGHLKEIYGVDWREVEWVVEKDVLTPMSLPEDVNVSMTTNGKDVGAALLDREIDAFIVPHPPEGSWAEDYPFRRLFPDAAAEDREFLKSHGYWPIMHLVVLPTAWLDEHDWLANRLKGLFEAGTEWAVETYQDPNGTITAKGKESFEDQYSIMKHSGWEHGLTTRNRANLEDFLRYCNDQGIAARHLEVEDLFHPSSIS